MSRCLGIIVFVGGVALLIACGDAPSGPNPDPPGSPSRLTGPYLGQQPPGIQPELFAPGLVSTGQQEISVCFSPNGGEFYLQLTGPVFRPRYFLFSRLEDTGWTPLRELTLSNFERTDSYPFVSPDGNRLYFCSNQPTGESGARPHHHEICYAERSGDGWGEPVRIDFGGGYGGVGTFPSVAANGNLYFNTTYGDEASDIYVSRYDGTGYSEPERLPDTVNTEEPEFHAFIAPDESYIMFDAPRTEDNFGSNDIYISFRNADGAWLQARNLGATVNGASADLRPFVTRDGRYLFFVSNRSVPAQLPDTPLTYHEIRSLLDRPGNGLQDIYWVSAEVIRNLAP